MVQLDEAENGSVDFDGANVSRVTDKNQLPNSIIVTQVPEEVFSDMSIRENFSQLFTQIEEGIHFDFLKSFRRVRVIFSSPENATAAKLIVQGFAFNGHQLKAFFAQRVILRNTCSLLSPPPLEKQFLISPPCSPPVGWAQTAEMPPVVCNFDLMSRLASFAIDEKFELHNGDGSTPAIVVHPCETPLDAPSRIELPKTPRPGSPAEA